MDSQHAFHEKVSTFLVSAEKSAQASQNEIRVALESSDDQAKIDAMRKAVAALLNGEQLPQLFITIVRYVLPSENHLVQKLLLLYLVRAARRLNDLFTLISHPVDFSSRCSPRPYSPPHPVRRRPSRRRTPPASSSPR